MIPMTVSIIIIIFVIFAVFVLTIQMIYFWEYGSTFFMKSQASWHRTDRTKFYCTTILSTYIRWQYFIWDSIDSEYHTGDGSPCRVLNGGCEDICTLDERAQVVCRCSPGRMLLADGRRCAVRMANCPEDQFECSSGFCIPYSYSCDGVAECPDGSDEDEKYCGKWIKLLLSLLFSHFYLLCFCRKNNSQMYTSPNFFLLSQPHMQGWVLLMRKWTLCPSAECLWQTSKLPQLSRWEKLYLHWGWDSMRVIWTMYCGRFEVRPRSRLPRCKWWNGMW